ncbi:hypothetical protein HG535_0A07370 [Zygotorulaspora mrakii]|uniref:pyridoxal kinase n=1 Tax=Zygotorulaspora mrakii TaxID=42260 RepID=A0A7H9AWQ7_ZYGMR|nr:uncharacterized protein HG535_0A07370 [Zygotorulaspora mrakii]QLG70795.1 hypothetical protein HG535_0A07370 [Zygotorulaspora mrakii]
MLNHIEKGECVRTPKVLSIQSHVVHGYVGNKAATFPLQYKGWDVDVLNTVQLSNHPGYGKFTGHKAKASDVYDILKKGLLGDLNMTYDAILTGYIPCTDTLKLLSQTLGDACKKDHRLKWIVDPVLGDNGKLYVSDKNVPVYKCILRENRLFMVTPNQFEMETLTGMGITSLESLRQGFIKFHNLYPLVERVVITSMEITISDDNTDYLVCACCDFVAKPDAVHYFKVPKLNAHFSGSGDLFTALLLDCLLHPTAKQPLDLSHTVSAVLSLVDDILLRTMDLTLSKGDFLTNKPSVINDLKLVNCLDLLAQPPGSHTTTRFRPTSIELFR